MSTFIATGFVDLDAAIGTGGLPAGELTELSGLPLAQLNVFLARFLGTERVVRVSAREVCDQPELLVQTVPANPSRMVSLLAVDEQAIQWIKSAETCRRLHAHACATGISIICAFPLQIYLNTSYHDTAHGLAKIAKIRLHVEPAPSPQAYRVRVVKNVSAAPYGEATIA